MLPTLNGVEPSWAEINTTINVSGGAVLQTNDYKALDWESGIKRGDKRGASGGRVISRTTGEKTDTASGTFYKGGLRELKRKLMAVAPKDSAGRPQLSRVAFDVVVKHSVGDDAEIYITKLLGCHLDKNAEKNAEGIEANTVDVDLNPIEIVEVIDGQDTVLL